MNKRKMFVRMILSSVLRRRSRVLIAILAVMIGATTLSGLATLAIDVPKQMAREMRSYGANLVVLPDDTEKGFSPEVLNTAKSTVPRGQLVEAVGLEYQPVLINDMPFMAAGTDVEALQRINPYWYVDGKWPSSPTDALVGKEVAERFGAQVGQSLKLKQMVSKKVGNAPTQEEKQSESPHDHDSKGNDGKAHMEGMSGPEEPNASDAQAAAPGAGESANTVDLKISGIVETGGPEDAFVYTDYKNVNTLTGKKTALTVAEFSIAADEAALNTAAEHMQAAAKGVSAEPVARLAHSDANVLNMLRSLMGIITVVVLALIMIGVSTTMMAVVTERRNEIGLRKALGASNRSIVGEFLGEGIVIGLVGGLGGAILGFALAGAVSSSVFHRSIGLHPWILLVTILAAIAVSALASLVPVRRAVDVDPALVLRGE
ncbi:FtsX-like permease family protein [Gleimia hominis]|uniref:FtsX-like permease family protein n=1 Tax=Gleimia hominis TaxID=595468 RepID=A0ABU3IBC8_9ACTO|nr:FtsX-like permease family protein [Gleimia hominis]MDT3767226.1 FtsX-like permease family protein [Gleimia hominis]